MLDIGCGNGSYLMAFKDGLYDFGVEPSRLRHLAEIVLPNIFNMTGESFGKYKRKFRSYISF